MIRTGISRIKTLALFAFFPFAFAATGCVGVDGGPLELSAVAKLAAPDTIVANEIGTRLAESDTSTSSITDSSASVTTAVSTHTLTVDDELGQVLGFELAVPTNATVTVSGGGAVASLKSPYTISEASDYITTHLSENGFTLVNETQVNGAEQVYVFQQDNKWVSITIIPMNDEQATINFAVTE